ncbi:MAG: hypothetical protein J7L11_00530 [Thermoprotei archaeon]|nr:hypothetical protein [Thermoprotei archaeon]
MRDRGVSQVLTTVILSSVMISILYISLFISDNVIEYHAQATEYENAKELLTYMADAMEQVALGTGGVKYVRFNLRTTRLEFLKDYCEEVLVKLNGSEVIRDSPDAIVIRGGDKLSAPSLRVLYPEGVVNDAGEIARYVVNAGEPITLVYETFDKRATTVLVCRRVRMNYLGIYELLVNGELRRYAVFELSYINLTIGTVGGSSTIPVVIRNTGTTVNETHLEGRHFTLEVFVGQERRFLHEYSYEDVDGILVLIKIAHLEVDTLR